MNQILQPLKSDSLVEVFISRFEDLILTGNLAAGRRLPSERELALQLGVSRPVVHEGLVDLAAKGLVTLKPRVGTVVNDFRKEGSLAILNSIVNYRQGELDEKLMESLLQTRLLVETETTRLAASHRTDEHMKEFHLIVDAEEKANPGDLNTVTGLDFAFHHLIGMASGNLIYPMLINSFKPVYMNFTSLFFSDPKLVPETVQFHRRMVKAIEDRDANKAAAIMQEALAHGDRHLRTIIPRAQRR
jgi:GntR family transcriptional regulator, transcriptional repressor for pyruvate dehydrogenase complex